MEPIKHRKLPDSPSALIRVALADLELAEKNPQYTVHMGVWHVGISGTCQVCLAGSVMAHSLGAPRNECVYPSSYTSGVARKLYALDSFGRGRIAAALEDMGFPNATDLAVAVFGIEHMPPHAPNSHAFKKQLRFIADMLELVWL